MSRNPTPFTTSILLTTAIAAVGMLAHNLLEFEPSFLLTGETLIPLGVYVVLALLGWAGIARGVILPALLGWAVLNLLGGGIASGLPLPFLPFTPDQSLGHYAAHLIYTVAEIPLIIVAVRAIRVGAASEAPAGHR